MASHDYRSYLAAGLSEDKVISYRLLSRALQVHVNKAKEMLFEFHRQQNARKPGSVHAIYIVAGRKHKAAETLNTNHEDTIDSSPGFRSSPISPADAYADDVPCFTISLVREEGLQNLRAQYECVTSIHIYSISSHPIKDLQRLSDVNREVSQLVISEDPLQAHLQYGTISNIAARRRTTKRVPHSIATSASIPKTATKVKETTKDNKPAAPINTTKPDVRPVETTTTSDFFEQGSGEVKPPAKPQLKRESSSIFKAFAKVPKLEQNGEKASDVKEDEPMKDISDDDEEDDFAPQSKEEGKSKSREGKAAREAALRAMMEESDDETGQAPTKPEEAETESKAVAAVAAENEPSTTEVPRRRGVRRVKVKKTIKDDEGYLITKEEFVDESFSEDEAPARKPKVAIPTVSSTAKAKPKKGQGNIMSFFGKK